MGQAPSGELVAARRGLTRAQMRAAGRAVRRGRAAEGPAVARLAVASARQSIRRRPPAWTVALFPVFVLGWAAFFIAQVLRGDVNLLGWFLGAMAVWGAWTFAQLRRLRRNAARAEQLNRAVLERAGQSYAEDASGLAPAEPRPAVLVASAVVVWVSYDLGVGALTLGLDGPPLSLGRVVAHGASFATFVTIVNLTWTRRRTARQSRASAG